MSTDHSRDPKDMESNETVEASSAAPATNDTNQTGETPVAQSNVNEIKLPPADTMKSQAVPVRSDVKTQAAPEAKDAASSPPPQTEAAYPSEAPPKETPIHYGRSRVVLMARDSRSLYAYWDISSIDRGRYRIGQPQGPSLLLRVYDLGDGTPGASSDGDFDLTLGQYETNAFITIPRQGRCWHCDFGILNARGEFVSLAISNAIKTPRETPAACADCGEEVWLTREYLPAAPSPPPFEGPADWRPEVDDSAREEIYRLSGGYQPVAVVSGSEQILPGAIRPVAFPVGASEQLPIPGVPTGVPVGLPSSEVFPPAEVQPRPFWLRVNTELIVYGQTEPDARVTIQGVPVELDPDGSFRVQFALPDGQQVIPVVAWSADGEQTRSVTPVVTRRTEDVNL